MAYSPFFQILHDERSPVGDLGDGTHYSVVRTLLPVLEESDTTFAKGQIFGSARRRLELLDLAIIWDEDHDERIWGVIERLHEAGLLAPVRFIGERKGSLALICDLKTDYGDGEFDRYCKLVEEHTATDDGDHWSINVVQGIGDGSSHIINASDERVNAYLRGIEASWKLGPSSWKHRCKTT
jgi:hypothetical protein